ncbi:60S ribosomal protein L31 [Candidatus Micrarchaeota archaeon]|nr:60S ribosomal protein L31 [Candidatus Micrarchaeota archaeon]
MDKLEAAKEAKAIVKEQKHEEARKQEKGLAEIAKETKPTPEEKKAAVDVKKEAKKELKEEKFEEKFLTLSLKDAHKAARCGRARKAGKVLKAQLKKHIKRDVLVDKSLNEAIWARGMRTPPTKIKVRVRITKDKATAYLAK